MPKKINFKILAKFKSVIEFNSSRQDPNVYDYSIYCTSKVKCQLCTHSSHKMSVQRAMCSNSACKADSNCPKQYKLLTRLKGDAIQKKFKCELYSSGKHNSKVIVKETIGINSNVKKIIEDVISEYDTKPKRIHVKLHKKRFKI